jgi:hypothetical protein
MVDEQCGCTVEGEPRYADLDGSRRAFVLNVWTPRLLRQQPWILEGWNESKHYDWRIITYAENPGFELTAMPTWIYYPRKTAALVPFAIAFETDVSEPFDAIVVETRWNITCNLGSMFLQRYVLACKERPPDIPRNAIRVSAALPIPQGAYALLTEILLPDEFDERNTAPELNKFDIFLTWSGNVVDSNADYPGYSLSSTVDLEAVPMTWTSNRAARPSLVTLGFTISRMPEPRSVVIWTPEGVTLNSAKAYEVASLNDAFPLESFDLTYLIKVLFTASGEIPAGTYKFRFPVYLPQRTTKNLWVIALCVEPLGCEAVGAHVVYPMPGLTIGSGQTTGVDDGTGSTVVQTVLAAFIAWLM